MSTRAVAAGVAGVALLVAGLLAANGVLALVEAAVGLMLLSILLIAYVVRRNSRAALFDGLSERRERQRTKASPTSSPQ